MSSKITPLPFKSILTAGLLILSSTSVLAESGLSVEQRLNRLENLLSNQVLIEQSQRMEQVQQELVSLRELLESQEHQLSMIKQRQRNLYQDMDRRLNDLEIKGGGSSASSMAAPTAAPASGVSPPAPPSGVVAAGATAASAVTASSVSTDKNGKSDYTMAFNTLKEGKYQQAIIEFKSFLQKYPDSVYGANAQYWLGEAYSVTRDYKTALTEFQKVVSQYPKSNKVEGAMLKIGYTYYEMQDWASARTSLEMVISKFPGSTVARKAKERLQRIKREGH